MLTPELAHIIQLMRSSIDRMEQEGSIKPREGQIIRLQDVFPFRPQDVESIYYIPKTGASDGILFRLKNGRVFDEHGKPAELRSDNPPAGLAPEEGNK
jgi:hypothetical protein